MMNNLPDNKIICCPPFNPELWQDKMMEWENKRFVKTYVRTLFFIPLNFGGVMKMLVKKFKDAGEELPDILCLSEHVSKWKMNIYLPVNNEISGLEEETFSGSFYSRVYEGNFKDTKKWCFDFEEILKDKNLKITNLYFWYTTCPKCAKEYGKNYVVLIGKVEKA